MTSRVQQQRAETSNTPPPANSLLPGQLYTELNNPVKLWVGVPTSIAPSQSKIVFDSTAWLPLSGGTMTGALTLANVPPGPYDAVPKNYVDGATGAAVPLAGGTMTGPLILSGAPTQALQAAPKNYVDTMVPLAGGTMTGLLTLSGPPTAPLGAATKAYADTMVPLAGGNMSGLLTLSGDPTAALGAVTKQYVDNRPGVTVGDAPPTVPPPQPGALWWDSVHGQLYIQYADANSNQWVIANQSGITEAPNDANTYGRHALGWSPVATQAAVNNALANVGRNLLHNGLFRVQQRGTGPWTANIYTADRWITWLPSGSCNTSVVTLSDAARAQIGDEVAQYALQCAVTGGTAAGAVAQLYQRVEGVRRLAGKTVTVSFWAQCSSALGLGVFLAQTFGTGGSPSSGVNSPTQVVTLSTTWTRYSLTFTLPSVAGMTFGTNGNDTTDLVWLMSAQANAAIGVQNGTFSFFGMQCEVAPQASPLEKIDPQTDLANCQRFFQYHYSALISGTSTVATGTIYTDFSLPVSMRNTPTVTFANTSYGTASGVNLNQALPAHLRLSITSTAISSTVYCSTDLLVSADL